MDSALQVSTGLLLSDNADPTGPDAAHLEDQSLLTAFAVGDHEAFTRVTLTIPALDKKNDIHVVHERWYSDDLQALVESIDDDPRFGMSTYELKEIKRVEPDPSLFKLPEGYTPTTNPDWITQR